MIQRLTILLLLLWPLGAMAQSVTPGPVTPSAWEDYRRAAQLFNAGERVKAGCVMYRAQFRARVLLLADPNQSPDGGPALFASLNDAVARPINQWLGGDRDDWIAAMKCARKWAAENDDPDYPRERHTAIYTNVLAGLDELIASIPPRAELRAQRRAAGLPNR